MNRTPDQAPRTADAATQRRDHRRRGEPPRTMVERRWRFADAVAAARQLSAGNASAT